ncbi:MAG: Sua5 family C-terminal domain-containing protein, partial [Gemmatimonadaceae bacterium]
VLRPGMIGRDAIARVAGAAESHGARVSETFGAPRSPGLLGKHYAPRGRVILVDPDAMQDAMQDAVRTHRRSSRVGVIAFGAIDGDAVRVMPGEPDAYARDLYAALHAMDAEHCDVVLIEHPPDAPEWAAIVDRLQRAAR